MIQRQLFNRKSIWIDVISNSTERDYDQSENSDVKNEQSIKKFQGSIIEDMAKDIFMKIVYKEIYRWDSDKGEFGGWVRTITTNWVKNFKKSLMVPMQKKRKIETDLDDKKNESEEESKNQKNYKRMQELSEEIINILTNGESVEGELIKKQQLQQLINCVHEKMKQFSKLYPDHAEVLCLSAFGDYDLKNIAEIMQKKYTTMKVFISDSKKRAYKFFLPCIKFMN
jgi:DNA-directed RNA polymerase specialized sigma24 family protein